MAIRPIYDRFDPIGHLNDFSAQQRVKWHEKLQGIFAKRIIGYPRLNDGPRPRFFDPTKVERKPDFTVLNPPVDWTAFPKAIKDQYGADRWAKADEDREVQDEYCEWAVQRDGDGKITRVTFTCEPYDYYDFLAETEEGRKKIVELYHEFVSPHVQPAHLFSGVRYNRFNQWNSSTTGSLMHLITGPNSLFAEIELGAGATIVRRKDGHIITEQDKLITCSGFGEETRNSDPTIGAAVNELARRGAAISFQNPVGLYLGRFEPRDWETRDGADPREFFKIVRGTAEFPVRAVFEVPAERGYTVSDITVEGDAIQYGSRITDFLKVKLYAVAQDLGGTPQILDGCKIRPSFHAPHGAFALASPLTETAAAPVVEEVMDDELPTRASKRHH